jgi:hypothetical protein
MKVISILNSVENLGKRYEIRDDIISKEFVTVKYRSSSSSSSSSSTTSSSSSPLRAVGVLNPLSKSAQKLSPFLILLRDYFNADVEIYLHTQTEFQETPLKTFYKYVMHTKVDFKDNYYLESQQATFYNLPKNQVLTLNMVFFIIIIFIIIIILLT